jgi:hypothetical protein
LFASSMIKLVTAPLLKSIDCSEDSRAVSSAGSVGLQSERG